jgi:hypothetical protein
MNWTLWLCAGLLLCAACAVAQSVARRALMRGVLAEQERVVGKWMRHAPSGLVGLCVAVGYAEHKYWGVLGGRLIAGVVPCAGCVKEILRAGGGVAVLMALRRGHVSHKPLNELVAALPAEVAAFKAAMESEAGE